MKHQKLNNKKTVYRKWLPLLLVLSLGLLPVIGCGRQQEVMKPYTPSGYLAASARIETAPVAEEQPQTVLNPFSALCVPTYITKVEENYFIVDCYNNQVIYNNNLNTPLPEWKVMTADLSMGHTLASDGLVYLIDDTENNRILIMEKQTGAAGEAQFIPTQEFLNIGTRPHYIIYDDKTDTFYAWSSSTGEMFLFRHPENDPTLYLTEIRSIESLKGVYVRSFTIIGDEIYFVSGNNAILRADLKTFQILEEYPVPDQLAGMIQITLIEDYYYITISTDAAGNQQYATLIRTKDLHDLAAGNYEDIYHHFIGGGTPYYISAIDGKWFMTEHRIPGHSIWSFDVTDNNITNVTAIY